MPDTADIHYILKHYWGYDDFRPLQDDIIRSVLDGRDTLGLMPTARASPFKCRPWPSTAWH